MPWQWKPPGIGQRFGGYGPPSARYAFIIHWFLFIHLLVYLFIYLLTYYSFNFPCFIQSFVCLICLINLLIRDLFIFTFFFIHLFIYISCQKNYKLETSCIVFLKYVHVTDSFVFSDLCNNRAVVHLILQWW